MLMKPEHWRRILEIWVKPGLSLRCQLLISRRVARQYQACGNSEQQEYRSLMRRLKRGLPFTKNRMDDAKASHRALMDMRKNGQAALAQWLLDVGPQIEHEIGVTGICDALAVNLAHRKDLDAIDEGRALEHLSFVAGLEDSAAHQSGRRPSTWKDGPLFQCYLERMLVLIDSHPDAMPDPFAPGGPLYGAPVRMVDGNGQAYTKRPAVTVHESDGSTRVIERKPEVQR